MKSKISSIKKVPPTPDPHSSSEISQHTPTELHRKQTPGITSVFLYVYLYEKIASKWRF